MPSLELHSVYTIYNTRSFLASNPVLKGIDMMFSDTEPTCVIGPSGSGKSTLLNVLNGKLNPSAGSIAFGGKRFRSYQQYQRFAEENILMIPQNPYDILIPQLSLYESISKILTIADETHRSLSPEERRDTLMRTLKEFGLEYASETKVMNLSGGETQRGLLVLAVSLKPRILLLDEPTAYLNVEYHRQLGRLIKNYAVDNDLVLITTSHSPEFINEIGNFVEIYNGHLRKIGSSIDLLNDEHTEVYLQNGKLVLPFEDYCTKDRSQVRITRKSGILNLEEI